MADEPVERLYVSIEADIAALLLKTAGAVDQVEKRLAVMEGKGKRSFDNTGKSAKKMGLVIGFVAGQVQVLTRMFLNMARQVPRAFAAVINATLEANKLFEKFSTQFTTLLGGTEAAQERVKELVEFNIKTPFELPEIVEASRVLEVFGGTLLATGDNLRMVGDIAAGVNRPIEDVALWIGRAYDALQNGRPFGIAALALQRMGALSGEARAELERMQKQGIKGEAAWQRFVELVGTRFAGNMERLAQTLVGIQSNLADFRTELLRLSGEPLFENIKRDAQRLLDVLTQNRQPLTDLGVALGEIAASVEELLVSGVLAQLEQLDPQAIEDLSDAMDRFADALSRLTDKEITGDINGLVEVLTILVDLLTSLINTVNKIKEPIDKFNEAIEPIAPALNAIKAVLFNLTNPLAAIISLVKQGTEAFHDLNDALELAGGRRLTETTKALAESTEPKVRRIPPRFRKRKGRGEVLDPITPVIDEFDENADKVKELLRDLAIDMQDEAVDRQDALEELEKDHAERMADIAEDGARKRAEIDRQLQKDLAKLAQDTAEKRADIFKDTQRELEDLARDTDDRLSEERDDFQTEERRDTEDHLRDMRRLTQQYLFDLEDAVKERDARAVVDLQRRFAMESQQREEDFTVNQQRDRQDFDERLAEIRDNEAQRRQEILRGQAEQLADLMENEARRRAEIQASHQEQLTRLDEQMALARAKENESYAERQADLQNALAERLQAIARELADEDNVNAEGARRILNTLNRFFGVGGDVDQLMNDFVRRRSQRMRVEISFEGVTPTAQESLGSTLPPGAYGRLPRFQRGGSMVARRPTLALFGEGGPELAQFTPLNQMGGGGGPQRIQIEFSGSAPPGIRGPERDQIASVLMSALRDTGALG